MRLKNYRRFLFMGLVFSVFVFLAGWGIVSVVQNVMLGSNSALAISEAGRLAQTNEEVDRTYLTLVNDENTLDAAYVPENLVVLNVESEGLLEMQEQAALDLKDLMDSATSQGFEFKAISAYRDFERQQALNAAALEQTGGVLVGKENTAAGTSEHQTGLAVDLASSETDFELRQDFFATESGRWLMENAPDFGFIIRYPQGKEEVTGNMFEPWHIRYVGKENAAAMARGNLTLEEYLKQIER